MRAKQSKYWTRTRTLDALRRFWNIFHVAPSSTIAYAQMLREMNAPHSFPSPGAILNKFPSMRLAWKATDIKETLPHCECGRELPIVANWRVPRCCTDCIPKRMSRAIRKAKAPRLKYVYTEEIDREIRRVYNEVPRHPKSQRVKNLAESLGWPRWAISKRACYLGLTKGYKEPNWSEEELAILEKFIYLTPQNIAKRLRAAGFSRTETAVNIQLNRRKIRRKTPWLSGHQFSLLIGEDGHKITLWAKQGLIPFKYRGTRKHGKQHGDTRVFHEVDIYLFLISERSLYDLRKVNQEWLLSTLIDYPQKHAAEIEARKDYFATWRLKKRRPVHKRQRASASYQAGGSDHPAAQAGEK